MRSGVHGSSMHAQDPRFYTPPGQAASIREAHVVLIDPSAVAQQFEGFGTSLAWWANAIGNPLRRQGVSKLMQVLFAWFC